MQTKSAENTEKTAKEVFKLIDIINKGARAFMFEEYSYMVRSNRIV